MNYVTVAINPQTNYYCFVLFVCFFLYGFSYYYFLKFYFANLNEQNFLNYCSNRHNAHATSALKVSKYDDVVYTLKRV